MKAIALILLGSAAFTFNDVTMKLALASMPFGQTVTIRGITSCILLFAVAVLKTGVRAAIWNDVRGQLEAMLWYVASAFLYIYSLPYLDFPVAVTAVYTAPLFSVLLAWWFLGEKLRPITIVSTLLGFVGVVLAVGFEKSAIQWMVILPVMTGLATAIRDIKLRRLIRSENSFSILITHQVGLTLFGITLALYESGPTFPPPAASYLSAAGASIGGMLGVYFIVEAFRISEIGSISAFRYSAILWAGLLGALIWGNQFDATQILGMLLVTASGATIAIARHMDEKTRGSAENWRSADHG